MDLSAVGHISLYGNGGMARRGKLGGQGVRPVFGLMVIDGHGVAAFGQEPCGCRADPAGRAGDESCFHAPHSLKKLQKKYIIEKRS
jgi:hypothetical protein